jgi:tRNA(Ile)-lysidine synthase
MLGISRQEILEFLKENKISYRLDKTNQQSFFLRNKIRNKLLPYLEKNFNGNIKQTISHSLESIREDYDLISELSKKELAKNKELRVSELAKLHPALQKRILREALEQKKSPDQEITSAHINEIVKIIQSTKSKKQTMKLKNLKIERKNDKLLIDKAF